MALSYLLWLLFTGNGWLVAFTVIFGLGYGVRIALTPVVLIEFFGVGHRKRRPTASRYYAASL
jgi:MFS family permease